MNKSKLTLPFNLCGTLFLSKLQLYNACQLKPSKCPAHISSFSLAAYNRTLRPYWHVLLQCGSNCLLIISVSVDNQHARHSCCSYMGMAISIAHIFSAGLSACEPTPIVCFSSFADTVVSTGKAKRLPEAPVSYHCL